MNLANFPINNLKHKQFNISANGQFIVQRKIFSDIYPDFPDLIVFKLYIYLCKSYQWKYQRINKAKSEMQKELRLSRNELNNALDWLDNHYFIERTNNHKQQMYQAKLLTAPDYNPFTNTYVSCKDIPFYTTALKDRNQGYIMIPADAITNEMLNNTATATRTWTYSRLKVYLLLYAHCWLEYFGGVNPNTVHLDHSYNIKSIDKAFYFNAKKSEHQTINIIDGLVSMNLFRIVNASFKNGVYLGDTALVPKRSGQVTHAILRPYYLAGKKVYDEKLDNKRGWMIL